MCAARVSLSTVRMRALAVACTVLACTPPMHGQVAVASSGRQIFNIVDYGAKNDGSAPATEVFPRRAIAAAKTAGGGTVFVPAGKYTSGPIELFSNMTLDIDAGATVAFPVAPIPFERTRYLGVEALAPMSSQRPRSTRPMMIVEEFEVPGGLDPGRGEGSGQERHDHAVGPRRGRADRHERVHVRCPVSSGPPGRAIEPAPRPDLDHGRGHQGEPTDGRDVEQRSCRIHQDHDRGRDGQRGQGLDQRPPRLTGMLAIARCELLRDRSDGSAGLVGRERANVVSRPPRPRRRTLRDPRSRAGNRSSRSRSRG